MQPFAAVLLKSLRRSTRQLGIDIRRAEVAVGWLPTGTVDPLTYQYAVPLRQVPFVPVEVADARSTPMGFRCDVVAGHPFALAVSEVARQDPDRSAEKTARAVLSAYYETVQPRSALELLDLTEEDAPGLVNSPADHWIGPWDERSVATNARRRHASVAEEAYGHKHVINEGDGYSAYGPVTERRLSFEVHRTVSLTRSIAANGFRYDCDKPLEVIGLRHQGEYRWLVTRGQHRFGACAACGIERVKARVIKIVRREDADVWPHVVGRTFSTEGAVKLFDRLFHGRAPQCATEWTRRVDLEQRARGLRYLDKVAGRLLTILGSLPALAQVCLEVSV